MYQTLEAAEILGRQSEAAHLSERIERVKKAINVAYFSSGNHNFIGDAQGANSLALRIGLGDERTVQNTVNKYNTVCRHHILVKLEAVARQSCKPWKCNFS